MGARVPGSGPVIPNRNGKNDEVGVGELSVRMSHPITVDREKSSFGTAVLPAVDRAKDIWVFGFPKDPDQKQLIGF